MQLWYCTGNCVEGNNITASTYHGIVLCYSLNNNVSGNNIVGNGWSGIYLRQSSSNTICHNDLINNARQVYDESWDWPDVYDQSINAWDDGYPSGGNFWSDYALLDTNKDGTGDTPYNIDVNNQDNYPLMKPWPSHDIAVTNAYPSRTLIGQGYSVTISATIANQGDFSENISIAVYADNTLISTKVLSSTHRGFTTVTFTWNTTGFALDDYIIRADITPVSGEADTTDNTYTYGTVVVTTPGDVNGDRKTNNSDLIELSRAYGSSTSAPDWNPDCDINSNNLTDVFDIFILGKNYGSGLQRGPVGYWKFDEGTANAAYDSSGNDHQGTVYGADWVDGYASKALDFSGAGDRVTVPDDPSLSGFTQLTLEAWIRADSLGAGQRGIINKGNGGGYTGDEYGLQLNYDKVTLVLSAGSPNGWILIVHSPPAIAVGQWCHVAATWNSTHYCIYFNGTAIASGPVGLPGATTHDTGLSLNIGAISPGGGWGFDGIIDEVRIYNYSRTAEEIWADYTYLPPRALIINPKWNDAPSVYYANIVNALEDLQIEYDIRDPDAVTSTLLADYQFVFLPELGHTQSGWDSFNATALASILDNYVEGGGGLLYAPALRGFSSSPVISGFTDYSLRLDEVELEITDSTNPVSSGFSIGERLYGNEADMFGYPADAQVVGQVKYVGSGVDEGTGLATLQRGSGKIVATSFQIGWTTSNDWRTLARNSIVWLLAEE
jgi:parallel beta-helix repeat protein